MSNDRVTHGDSGSDSGPTAPDRVPPAEYAALGCGCLLLILMFGVAIALGIARG